MPATVAASLAEAHAAARQAHEALDHARALWATPPGAVEIGRAIRHGAEAAQRAAMAWTALGPVEAAADVAQTDEAQAAAIEANEQAAEALQVAILALREIWAVATDGAPLDD